MGKNNEPVEVEDIEVLREAGKALVCKRLGDIEEFLIPRSQIDPTSNVREIGDIGTLTIPEWLALDRDLL